MVDQQLGEFGEQEARSRLERALIGAGVRFAGASDKGLDLLLQFDSPALESQPVHVAIQVKTGDSFAALHRGRWHIRNLDPARFRQWTRSKVPVLFVWVRPTTPAECYWALVKRDSSREHFTVGRRAVVSPAIRFDLWLELSRDGETTRIDTELLRPPLSTALRPHAKEYYREHLLGETSPNPVVGPVVFTWSGWRHLTRRGRKNSDIHESLTLLPAARAAVAAATRFRGLRRLSHVVRGNWTFESRLVALRGPTLHMKRRAPAETVVVIHEQICYPVQWPTDVTLHNKVQRLASFHSIYEKVQVPRP